jgi:hypothetical protein
VIDEGEVICGDWPLCNGTNTVDLGDLAILSPLLISWRKFVYTAKASEVGSQLWDSIASCSTQVELKWSSPT